MSLLDVINDPEARYMLAYCITCAVPITLFGILVYRVRHSIK